MPPAAHVSLKDRIRQRQPQDLPASVYVSGWVQALIQLAVFSLSLGFLQGETRPVSILLLSMAFGWAWFCLLMVGHDAMHQAFVPMRWLNQAVAFLTLDCLLVSRASWFHAHHVVHHTHPYSKNDRMYLRGDSVAGDLWNMIVLVLIYVVSDIGRLLQRPTWHEWLGMGVRVALFWALAPLALLPAILFLVFFGSYLGLLAHALPVGRGTTDPVLRQLRTTWDLYPGSFVASLLTGGLNAHATHHVYPSLPRGAQPLGTHILREEAGAEHRCVDTLAGLWTLARLRGCRTLEVATIGAIAHGRVRARGTLLRGPAYDDLDLRPFLQSGYLPASPKNGFVDLRAAERRTGQMPIPFPDRRARDRRSRGAYQTP
jgi:fatty acid desaturase